jgi:hypothetical protein
MVEEPEEEYRGWRVVEGPGTEDVDENVGPRDRDLGEPPVLGAGYGASTGGVEGEPGPPGPAPGEIPEHTGPLPIVGIEGLAPAHETGEDGEPP